MKLLQQPPGSPAQHVMDADEALLAAISLSLAVESNPTVHPDVKPPTITSETKNNEVEAEESKTVSPLDETPKKAKKEKKKKKKKKKKKNSYKDFMKSMLSPQKTSDQAREAHRDKLQKNLGGGAFEKIDKI